MPEARRKKMVNSFVWTDEEAKYLKAVLKWKENDSHSEDDDSSRRPTRRDTNPEKKQLEQQKPAGEFRILVIGAKGTGKTSILTRFATGTFPGESQPPDPFYSRGCRHRIELDSSLSFPGQQSPSPTIKSPIPSTQTYIIDALEMPSKHLPSDPMLEQALNITEAGVLVYDVLDQKSLQLALGIADFVREYLDKINSPLTNNKHSTYPRRREFPLILIGNKSDVGEGERAVPWSEGSKTANKMTSSLSGSSLGPQGLVQSPIPFVEVSAKTGENIDVIFPRLARDVLKSRWQVQQQSRLQREGAAGLQIHTGTGTGQGGGGYGARKGSLYSSEGGSHGKEDGVWGGKRGFWRRVRGVFGRVAG